MIDIRAVQRRLMDLGYSVGPAGADGVIGAATKRATAQFQKDRDLKIQWPGTIGPTTLRALGLLPYEGEILPPLPLWFQQAQTFLNLHEVRDSKKLDKILKLDASEIPWCGAFLAMVFQAALPAEPLPSNPLGSRNWQKMGFKIDGPQIGAVAVFWRGSPEGWQGHVTLVAGHDTTHVHGLGGNQSDSVNVSRISKKRLLGYYWPITAETPPKLALPRRTIQASTTENEA